MTGRKRGEKIRKILPLLKKRLASCSICPRLCGVDRTRGEKGYCRSGLLPLVYNSSPHMGEEPPISGVNGSGTIFFSGCNMKCVYCQNFQFSQNLEGKELTPKELASVMMDLEKKGCHNINLVTPTHLTPQIVEALSCAYEEGLTVPIVYNTGGYDSLEVIKLLDGVMDVYMPDMRYSKDEAALKYSDAPGYASNNRLLIKEMYRQVGSLKVEGAIAKTGLLIRLLVLPEDSSGTLDTLEFIAGEVSRDVYLSVMSQYYPAYKARSFSKISRRVTEEEYERVVRRVKELGFTNGWLQPFSGGFDEVFQGENFSPNI